MSGLRDWLLLEGDLGQTYTYDQIVRWAEEIGLKLGERVEGHDAIEIVSYPFGVSFHFIDRHRDARFLKGEHRVGIMRLRRSADEEILRDHYNILPVSDSGMPILDSILSAESK
ncbi:hypothetical protein LJC07_08335 [Christensenellaceae bacterium OttesenSCG-928-L17]|nr:hypothetical protein [Christensenellaceae bacterium OttesenSCG-928-L17]